MGTGRYPKDLRERRISPQISRITPQIKDVEFNETKSPQEMEINVQRKPRHKIIWVGTSTWD